jgi:hypothetical protein
MFQQVLVTRFVLVSLAFVAAAFGGQASHAQDFGPCTADVYKFCQDIPRGQGDVAKCLAQNQEGLSPGCQGRLSALSEQVKEAGEACGDDIMMLCGDVQPGGGRVAQCLKGHESWLSFNCKVKLGLVGFSPQN